MRMVATRQWTVDEVLALPDDGNRYELIDGELLVTPSPALVHQYIVGRLHAALLAWLEPIGAGEALLSPADLRLTPETIVQPDVFVVPIGAEPPRNWPDVKRLLLAIEVLSPSTSRADRVRKREFYLRVSVPEYWIVDPDARLVERWRQGEDRPAIVDDELRWDPFSGHPAFTLSLPELFRRALREP